MTVAIALCSFLLLYGSTIYIVKINGCVEELNLLMLKDLECSHRHQHHVESWAFVIGIQNLRFPLPRLLLHETTIAYPPPVISRTWFLSGSSPPAKQQLLASLALHILSNLNWWTAFINTETPGQHIYRGGAPPSSSSTKRDPCDLCSKVIIIQMRILNSNSTLYVHIGMHVQLTFLWPRHQDVFIGQDLKRIPPIDLNVMDLNFNCDLFITVQRTMSLTSFMISMLFVFVTLFWSTADFMKQLNRFYVCVYVWMLECIQIGNGKVEYCSCVQPPLGNWLMRKSHFIDIVVASGFHIITIERNELLLLHRNGTQSPELYLHCPFPPLRCLLSSSSSSSCARTVCLCSEVILGYPIKSSSSN